MRLRRHDPARQSRRGAKLLEEAEGLARAFSELAAANTVLTETLQAEKEKFASIFHDTQEGLVLTDREGRILMINPAARALLGRQARAVETLQKTLAPEHLSRPGIPEILSSAARTVAFEWERRDPKLLILAGVADRLGTEPEIAGYLFIFHDATIEKRGEMLSRDFLSLVSHKLRTPLAAALGFLEIIKRNTESLSAEQRVALSKAQSESERLRRLVEKLIAFSTVQSPENIVLERLETSLSEVVDCAITSAGGIVDDSVVLKWDPQSCAAMPTMSVDLLLIKEVLANLIENAVKFNPAPRRLVEISVVKDESYVRISVRDNGPGIPGEEQAKLFRKFYQVDEYFTCQAPGFGLGLAFAKNVVEAHGGAVGMTSEVGIGSEFFFTLPLA
ncbi:MAG: PAS domain-containing protein [Elusimicrobia bacterium]|nr:PAS domain-containing protein [Elusimicrobiota bacterium]